MAQMHIIKRNYYEINKQLGGVSSFPFGTHPVPKSIHLAPPFPAHHHHWTKTKNFTLAPTRLRRISKKAKMNASDIVELPEIGIPGVRNMLNASYSIWGKLIWFVVLVMCTSICVYQVTDRLVFFLSYPLRAEVTNVINQSLAFPLISLCPYNPFQRDEAVIALKEQMSMRLNKSIKSMKDLWHHMPNESYDLEVLWDMTEMDKPAVSQRCGFGRKANQCNFHFEVKEKFKTFFGYCWILGKRNSEPIDYQGPMTGMTIKINESDVFNVTRVKEYGNGDIDEQSIGYSIYIHDEETSPKFDAFYRGLTIYHSVNTILSLGIKKFIFLNTTQHPCSVSQVVSECWDNCIEDRILDAVTCRLPFIDDTTVKLCTGKEDYNTSYLGPRYVYLAATPENCNCPRRCEKIVFTPNTYTVRDPNFPHRTMIMISFQDNMYELVKEMEAFPIIAFFSDIGGTLGLFLGVCILTLGEVFEIVVVLVKRCIREGKCMLTVQQH